jgi:flagellar protein FliO/FliZ
VADSLLLGLRVALSLAFVLVVLWFVARKVSGAAQATRRVPITVLGRQGLGRRSGVAVLDVAGRTLVVGVSDAGVRLLTELDLDEPESPADGEERAGTARTTAFEDVLGDVEDPDVPRHRARRRAGALEQADSPLAGSVLDRRTWARARAAIKERSVR